jgi:hypothetical protein
MSQDKGLVRFENLMVEFIPKKIEPYLKEMRENGKIYIEQKLHMIHYYL